MHSDSIWARILYVVLAVAVAPYFWFTEIIPGFRGRNLGKVVGVLLSPILFLPLLVYCLIAGTIFWLLDY